MIEKNLGIISFNPRTREGCDLLHMLNRRSIDNVSIHAPARGATQMFLVLHNHLYSFNPRTREGCDPHSPI